MTEFITINIGVKETVLVSKEAILDVVQSVVKATKDVQLIQSKSEVMITIDGKNFKVSCDIKIKKGKNTFEKIKELNQKIENHSIYLIDRKPQNIVINYVGSY